MKPEEPTQDPIQSSCPITDIQNNTVTISHCIPKE